MIIASISEALGWTLVHSLWQGSLVALGLYLIYPLVRKPTYLYKVAVGALLLISSWSIYTFFDLYHIESLKALNEAPIRQRLLPSSETANTPSEFTQIIPQRGDQSWLERGVTWIEPYIEVITLVWLLGMAVFSARLAGGHWYLLRIRRIQTAPLPAWEGLIQSLSARLGIRCPVTALSSRIVKTPLVIGHLKPIILFPIAMLSSFPPDQIEAVIAHELAHIRRHDHWVNLMQSLIEILLFFHPAVWWVSSVVRQEREKCCDDLAVSLCGNPIVYITALTEAESLRHTSLPFALAFARKKGSLLARIERLVHPKTSSGSPTVRLLVIATTLLLVTYLAVGDTLAHRASMDEPWIAANNTIGSLSHSLPLIPPDTTLPEGKPKQEEGWEPSPKTKTFVVPLDRYKLPQRDEEQSADTRKNSNRFSFHIGDSSNFAFGLNFGDGEPSGDSGDPYVYLHFGDDDEGFQMRSRRGQVYVKDTVPRFLWNDSLWLESVGEAGERMESLAEELKGILTDSVVTGSVQRHLAEVQRELGELQAELGSSLERSFDEEQWEEWQDRLEESQENAQREMEKMQRTLEKSRERLADRQQRQEEAQAQRQRELRSRRNDRNPPSPESPSSNRNFDHTVDQLEAELLADELIVSGEEYRFELKPKGLFINRKKQKSVLLEKYRDLLDVSENTSFSITRVAK